MSAQPISGLPGGVSLGSAPSEELLEELEQLRAMERRAIEVRDSDIWMGEPAGAAAYILGEAE